MTRMARLRVGHIFRITAVDHHSDQTANPVVTFVGVFTGYETARHVRFVRLACVYHDASKPGQLQEMEAHSRIIQKMIVGIKDLGGALE